MKNEAMLLKHKKGSNVSHIEERPYQVPPHGTEKLNGRPVIVGSGPAGLFCAYVLAKEGYRPLVLNVGQTWRSESQMWNISGKPGF